MWVSSTPTMAATYIYTWLGPSPGAYHRQGPATLSLLWGAEDRVDAERRGLVTMGSPMAIKRIEGAAEGSGYQDGNGNLSAEARPFLNGKLKLEAGKLYSTLSETRN